MIGTSGTAGSRPTIRTAVLGASGFTGAELLRLCAQHPLFEVDLLSAATHAGEEVGHVHPHLAAAYEGHRFAPFSAKDVEGFDLVFLALPHGYAMDIVPLIRGAVGTIVDLSADFRLNDPGLYPEWYGLEHRAPELLEQSVLGIPELYRERIAANSLIAAAGCYVTCAALGLAPLVGAGAIQPDSLIVDAASGVSGAGNSPRPDTGFATANEDFRAYGLLNHRHTPEIEQAIGARVLFTPHLAPMTRGILATSYARPTGEMDGESLIALLATRYKAEPFIEVMEMPPSTKMTWGSNTALITARVDRRTGWAIVLCALDNLVKGASGQAIQCANIALGLDETLGLPKFGVFP